MRYILLSLILVLVTSGFVLAESTSNIQTDFYISNISSDFSGQDIFSGKVNEEYSIKYWISILVIITVTLFILQKILKSKQKEKRRKRKNSRRKK